MIKFYRKRISALALTSTIALLGLGACSAPTATQSNSSSPEAATENVTNNQARNATPTWQRVAQHGTQIYGLAKAGDWEKANLRLNQLKQRTTQLKQDNDFSKLDLTALDTGVQTLEQAVNAKDSQTAMREANEVSFQALTLAKEVQPSDRVNVLLLGYHTRKLELATQAQDTTTASASAKEIQQTWAASQSSLESGGSAESAKKVGQLVQKLETAQSIQEYQDLAPDLLKAERSLEKSMNQAEKQ
jgi:hypothetical protein